MLVQSDITLLYNFLIITNIRLSIVNIKYDKNITKNID